MLTGIAVQSKFCLLAVSLDTDTVSGWAFEIAGNGRDALGTTSEKIVILTVGRMERLKGHEDLIKALPGLPKEIPWECWIFGEAQGNAEVVYAKSLRAVVST